MADKRDQDTARLLAQLQDLSEATQEFRREFGQPANLAQAIRKLQTYDEAFTSAFGGPEALNTRLKSIENMLRSQGEMILDIARKSDRTWATAGAIVAAVVTTLAVVASLIKIVFLK